MRAEAAAKYFSSFFLARLTRKNDGNTGLYARLQREAAPAIQNIEDPGNPDA
jgi:hypothetical protein